MGLHTCVCNPILYQKQLAQESINCGGVDNRLEKRQPLSGYSFGRCDIFEELRSYGVKPIALQLVFIGGVSLIG